jgi:uncharacterized protein YutE (UPF0331/DUF86 family)
MTTKSDDVRVYRIVKQHNRLIGSECAHLHGMFSVRDILLAIDGDVVYELLAHIGEPGESANQVAVQCHIDVGKCQSY